ncbi:alanine acetyltransferase [Serinibacter arcticus]|uniref:Alanine acetyltransferase n=1 Tax=Serinibacter arcticus TaxID=1655435 RepID=A0A2U1ZVS0_9MICO|nr:GNAT family protein [Serinibacter arcticus]PWD51022.1 alanine acetyltransferase [Serinibacter arcticus]
MNEPGRSDGSVTRLLTVGDVPELTAALRDNRAFLKPWEPTHEDAYFTVRGQDLVTRALLTAYGAGTIVPLVILDDDGAIVGRITLTGIVRGAFLSGTIGYWVAEHAGGRGLATAAVGDVVDLAFGRLGLHRVEAGTLLHNAASQRVLAKNGFTRYGEAPSYLRIDGAWRDHVLFQRVREEPQLTPPA